MADLSHLLGSRDFVGTTFSYADLTAWDYIDQVAGVAGVAVDTYPNLAAWQKRVASQKGVAEYLAQRK